jgi:hypothetical protein
MSNSNIRLARAVRPQEPGDRSRPDREAQPVDRRGRAEPLGQAADLDNRHGRRALRRRTSAYTPAPPTATRTRTTQTTIIAALADGSQREPVGGVGYQVGEGADALGVGGEYLAATCGCR